MKSVVPLQISLKLFRTEMINDKALGENNVIIEMIRYRGQANLQRMCETVKERLVKMKVCRKTGKRLLYLILKKGDKTRWGNFRGC